MADYIKREDVQNVINTWIEQPDKDLRAKLIQHDLNAIPAADVREVVHGRWIDGKCTACRKYWDDEMVMHADDCGYFDPMPPFCPNCGAMMDGEG